jgi:hypothetical protein
VAAPVAAAAAAEELHPLERREIAERGVGDEHDVAAPAAVTAVGTPAGHMFLAPKAEGAMAAAPGLDADGRSIVKHASAFGGG